MIDIYDIIEELQHSIGEESAIRTIKWDEKRKGDIIAATFDAGGPKVMGIGVLQSSNTFLNFEGKSISTNGLIENRGNVLFLGHLDDWRKIASNEEILSRLTEIFESSITNITLEKGLEDGEVLSGDCVLENHGAVLTIRKIVTDSLGSSITSPVEYPTTRVRIFSKNC